jgi:ABC-type nitrate/sulfonate/bicarbonate transport system substrate-binding protein
MTLVHRLGRYLLSLLLVAVLAAPAMADAKRRIGYQKGGTLIILKAHGAVEKRLAPQGVGVEWVEFAAGPVLLEALGAGSIDFGLTGEAPPIFAQAAGNPLLYVGVEPPQPAGEAILVAKDSPITSLADLRGKRVALFREVILPGALPSVLVGVRYALGITWLTLIVAETVSASSGIGYMTMNAREFLQADVVVLGILIYAILGKLADASTRLLERWLAWHPAFQPREAV